MIAADADGMVAWRRLDAEANDVVDDLERGRRRTDPLFLCDIFFQYVVLQCPLKMSGANSLAFRYRQIHGEKNNGWAIDSHRYAHLIERDVAKECFHVRQGVDGNPASSHLAFRSRIVGVVAHESRHVRSEEHTSELQSLRHLVCRLLLEKKN